MKRDMDLIRRILLEMEDTPSGYAPVPFHLEGFDADTVGFHCHLMLEAALITGVDTTEFGSNTPTATPLSLTWKGYEFLDAAREATTWNKAKGLAAGAGNSSFKILLDVLTKLALGQLGL
jgi:hypothetical protein